MMGTYNEGDSSFMHSFVIYEADLHAYLKPINKKNSKTAS